MPDVRFCVEFVAFSCCLVWRYAIFLQGFTCWLLDNHQVINFEKMEATVATSASDSPFLSSFLTSVLMITASEIGDKTFFITALMAVKNSRLTVFLGSMAGLTLNNVISSKWRSNDPKRPFVKLTHFFDFLIVFLGVLTGRLSTTWMHHISVGLFLLFGLKMIYEGLRMTEEDGLEEYNEAQKAVEDNEVRQGGGREGDCSLITVYLCRMSIESHPFWVNYLARRFSSFSRFSLLSSLPKWATRHSLVQLCSPHER